MIQESVYGDWYNSHSANSTGILRVMDQGTLSIPKCNPFMKKVQMLSFSNLKILSWKLEMIVIQRTSLGRVLIISAILFYNAWNLEETQWQVWIGSYPHERAWMTQLKVISYIGLILMAFHN